ncbi:hypothetical protein SDC9_184992 [bioreactor metagenome]|uniref:Uncharacterized protein n=1 Tax=bioreactor metagenome TaxID=1076179 RepID=A0A645HQ24_9ZZZZ
MRGVLAQHLKRGLDLLGRHQPHGGAGRVMRQQRARGARRVFGHFFLGQRAQAAGALDVVTRDRAGAQQHGHAARAVDDGGFDADLAGAAIQHQQFVAKFRCHVRCRGGAHAAKLVGAGRGHTKDGRILLLAGQQQRVRHGVRWAAHAHAVLSAG